MSEKTAAGLRDRLFDALDKVISKEISTKEVESICYVSEQIIKTARVELEEFQERNRADVNRRNHELTVLREEKESVLLLGNVIDAAVDMDDQDEML